MQGRFRGTADGLQTGKMAMQQLPEAGWSLREEAKVKFREHMHFGG
jgi:hypothetical protein